MLLLLFSLLVATPTAPISSPTPIVAAAARHDIHLSLLKATVSGNTVALHTSFFKDDLGKMLLGDGGADVDALGSAALGRKFLVYFGKHFGTTANGGAAKTVLSLVTVEDEGDVYAFDLKLTATAPIQTLVLRHTVLFEIYSDQKNLMVLKAGGDETTFLFSADAPQTILTFDLGAK